MPPKVVKPHSPRKNGGSSRFADPDMESPTRGKIAAGTNGHHNTNGGHQGNGSRRNSDANPPSTPDAVAPTEEELIIKQPRMQQQRRSTSPSPPPPESRLSSRPGSRAASQPASPRSYSSATRTRSAVVTLENFETSWKSGPLINSPRSLNVCAKYGIDPRELLYKPYEAFTLGGAAVSEAIARRRFEHSEGKRLQKLDLLRSERLELIEQERQMAQRGDQTPRSAQRSRTPTAGNEVSPARESARRLRDSQRSRLAQLEKEREQHAKQLAEELEVRTALAAVQKFSHDHEVKAGTAREHLDQVVETSKHAKRLLAINIADKRNQATRHELERAIKALDAQAKLLRVAQERGQRHEETLSEARHRASSATASARAHHEHHLLQHEQTATECEQRHADLMARRKLHGMRHDDYVADRHEHAEVLAARARKERLSTLTERELELESRLNERESATTHERAQSASTRRQKESAVRHAAQQHLAQARATRLRKQLDKQAQLNERVSHMLQDNLKLSEDRREIVLDRAEEVARVRRAREFERKQQLLSKHAAHGCVH
jgi:hypothetical protein